MKGNYGSLYGNDVEETFAYAGIKTPTGVSCYDTPFVESTHHIRLPPYIDSCCLDNVCLLALLASPRTPLLRIVALLQESIALVD